MLRLAAASGILDILQSGGMDAEDLLHLERFGYEPSPKARKRSKVRHRGVCFESYAGILPDWISKFQVLVSFDLSDCGFSPPSSFNFHLMQRKVYGDLRSSSTSSTGDVTPTPSMQSRPSASRPPDLANGWDRPSVGDASLVCCIACGTRGATFVKICIGMGIDCAARAAAVLMLMLASNRAVECLTLHV